MVEILGTVVMKSFYSIAQGWDRSILRQGHPKITFYQGERLTEHAAVYACLRA